MKTDKDGYKSFSLTVNIRSWLPYPWNVDFDVKKSNFPAWFVSDWLNQGIADDLIKETLDMTFYNIGLFRITGKWRIISWQNYMIGEPTDYDAEFKTKNLKVVRICRRKR